MDMNRKNIEMKIEEIDKEFRDQGVAPFKRPLAAIVEFGRRNNISLPIVVNRNAGSNVPYPKENEFITDLIHSWYTKHYGDALKIDFSPGSSIVEILGNIYELKIPKVWGSVNIIWNANFDHTRKNSISSGPVSLNLAEHIPKLTSDLAGRVEHAEQSEILRWFVICFNTFNTLQDRMMDWRYRDQILTNIDSSFRYLVAQVPNYGESIWSSLQATEKAIKSVLVLKGHNPKWLHELEKLAGEIQGHPKVRVDLLKDIQCKAGVRYGDEPIDLARAKKAHCAMIEFIHDLMELPI